MAANFFSVIFFRETKKEIVLYAYHIVLYSEFRQGIVVDGGCTISPESDTSVISRSFPITHDSKSILVGKTT